MKKRTKITLTIVELLALTGVFYAANPTYFANVPNATGVAAGRADLLVSEFCTGNIDKVACDGTFSLFATIPQLPTACQEKYLAMAPSQSAMAGFTPRDVFITQGDDVFKFSGGTLTLFATIPCGARHADHTGITFDHVGTFGFNMIVTCQNGGGVWTIDGTGTVTPIASTGTPIEGPAVAPSAFGPFGGQLLVADEDGNAVHAIRNDGTVTLNVFQWSSAESVVVIGPCAFCSGGAFFWAMQLASPPAFIGIYQYPLTDFTGLVGSILVTGEFGASTALITFNGTNYVQSSFNNIPGGQGEGSSFVDCDIPLPASQITHTLTTCTDFLNGTGEILSSLSYSVKFGRIKKVSVGQVAPGVFFYWVKVTVPAGPQNFTITQTHSANGTGFFDITNSNNVFDSNCTSVRPTNITQDTTTGAVTAQFTALTAGTYIISLKYSGNSLVGDTAPTGNGTVHYVFATMGVPDSTVGVDLIKQ